ncbi:MAG TPA: DinB family protein [Dehalococcoidia bacterium]|jgi:uncharacterized damage-inducible protein DinB|nr:DinB family protein [Dehalococcoidia bacterium]
MTFGMELLLRHNAWANLELIDACSRLPDADLAATLDGAYGPVTDTLHHIIGNEAAYLMVYGVQIEGAPAPGERFARWETLRALALRTGEALVEQARLVDPERRLKGEMNGRAYDMAAGIPLAQAVHHGTDHRSQVASILSSRGIEPPMLSVWAFAEASGQLWV